MRTKFSRWYESLTPPMQVAVAFGYNWLLWFAGSLLGDYVFYDEMHSLMFYIFHAIWMALFMTAFFNWNGVKALFKRDINITTRADG